MKKNHNKFIKHISVICFAMFISFAFQTNVFAKGLWLTCKYEGDNSKATLRIFQDYTAELKMDLYKGDSRPVLKSFDYSNWVKVKNDLDRLKCPTIVQVDQTRAFYKKTTADKHKHELRLSLKKTVEEKNIDKCLYDDKGNLAADSASNKAVVILKTGSDSVTFKSLSESRSYDISIKNEKDFFTNGTFSCLNKVYYDEISIQGDDFKRFGIYTSAALREAGGNKVVDDLDQAEKGNEEDRLDDNPAPGSARTDLCSVIDPNGEFYKILQQIGQYIQIGTVFLILVLGMMDLAGAVGSDKDEAFKKAISKFGKRLIAGVLVFLTPVFVSLIISVVNLGACGQNGEDTSYNIFQK